jgi:hypothetical protein
LRKSVTAFHCGHDTQPATTLRQVSKEKVPVAEAELAPPEEQDEIDLKGKSLSELRAIALAAATTPKAPSKESQRTYYVRSAKVKAYVLQRANGCCEACKKAAEVLVPGRKKRKFPSLGSLSCIGEAVSKLDERSVGPLANEDSQSMGQGLLEIKVGDGHGPDRF